MTKSILYFIVSIILITIGMFAYYKHEIGSKQDDIRSSLTNNNYLLTSESEDSNKRTDKLSTVATADKSGDGFTLNDDTQLISFTCISLNELESRLNADILDDFFTSNSLTLFSVNEYLKHLDHKELEMEFEAGNASAAFILGMHFLHSSYRSGMYHPDIRTNQNDDYTEFDSEKMKRARDWLWTAALNGVGTALGEIAGSYLLEKQLVERDILLNTAERSSDNSSEKIDRLTANYLSYTILYNKVNPQIVDLFSIDTEISNIEMERLNYLPKTSILDNLKEQWRKARLNVGKSAIIPLQISEEVETAVFESENQCDNN